VTRIVPSWLCSLVLLLSSALPPSHIHLAEHDHDHDHAAAIEHSHWSPHGPSRLSLDDDDGRAIFVDHPAIASDVESDVMRPAAAVIALLASLTPETFTVAERTTSGNSPRDGPASLRQTFRGPPLAL
jgi:hypothetical protein